MPKENEDGVAFVGAPNAEGAGAAAEESCCLEPKSPVEVAPNAEAAGAAAPKGAAAEAELAD